MKVVIDIPDHIYNTVVDTGKFFPYRFNTTKAIKNGTPIPKGCGDMIDKDEYVADIKEHYFDNDTVIRCTEIAMDNAKTIIESDKGE